MPKRASEGDDTPVPAKRRVPENYSPPITRKKLEDAKKIARTNRIKEISSPIYEKSKTINIEHAVDLVGPTLRFQTEDHISELVGRIVDSDALTRSKQSTALARATDYLPGLSPDHKRKLADAALTIVETARRRAGSGRRMDGDAIAAVGALRTLAGHADTPADLSTHIDGRLDELSDTDHIRRIVRNADHTRNSGLSDDGRMYVRSGDISTAVDSLKSLPVDRAIAEFKTLVDRTLASSNDVEGMIQAVNAITSVHDKIETARDVSLNQTRPNDRSRGLSAR